MQAQHLSSERGVFRVSRCIRGGADLGPALQAGPEQIQ